MDSFKCPPNSYSFSYMENIKSNQPVSCTGSNYIHTQSNSSYDTLQNNEITHAKNTREGNAAHHTNTNEFAYWDDKSLRNEPMSTTKFEDYFFTREHNFNHPQLFSPYNDLEKNINLQQRTTCNEWCSTNINNKMDFPPCAEKIDSLDATIMNRHINIQKSKPDTHQNYVFDNTYCTDVSFLANTKNNREIRDTKCELPNNYNYYEYFDEYSGLNNYLGLTTSTPNTLQFDTLDQQTEISNEDSDIIVEETDEEITDFSENQDRKIINSSNKCIVCNMSYIPQGVQFYYLTSASPVTMTSQQPVFLKLKSLIGPIRSENNNICSECLGLLNSIDHLQSKLDNFKNEFLSKFRKTGLTKETQYIQNSKKLIKRKSFSCYRCKYCCKILSFKNYCRYHILQHRNKNLLCEKCGILCRTIKIFHKHMCKPSEVISNLSVKRPFSCSNCNKSFRTKTHFNEHQNFCLGILPYICKLSSCKKKFASSTRLKNHMRLKHDKKFVAICSICNIGFVKLSDYKSHKVSHSTDKRFQCQKCDKSYKTLSNLNFHLKSHQETMPFLCNICGKGFMRKEYLETHVYNHKGIKKFSCSICYKKFTSQKNLDSHFKCHDSSLKKKICNICGKSLTTSMNEHLRIHTNLREFECNRCDLKFNTKGTMMKHKKAKHTGFSRNS